MTEAAPAPNAPNPPVPFMLDAITEAELRDMFIYQPEDLVYISFLIAQSHKHDSELRELQARREELKATNNTLRNVARSAISIQARRSLTTPALLSSSISFNKSRSVTVPWSGTPMGEPVPEDWSPPAAAGDDALPEPVVSPQQTKALVSSSENAADKAEDVLRLCLRRRLPFVDPSFRPCDDSLYREGLDAFVMTPNMRWGRPRSYLPRRAHGEELLFTDAPNPQNIGMGATLPDYNLLSAVSILSEHPVAIVSLLGGGELSRATMLEQLVGAYRVHLCIRGWWRSVLVDDYVPVSENTARPEFARCRHDLRALWLPLLEKAYAKSSGSYAAILENGIADTLSHLSGAPCYSLSRVKPRSAPSRLASRDPKAQRKTSGSDWVALTNPQKGLFRDGRIILSTHSLSTVSAQEKLRTVYAKLGLAPAAAVVVLGSDEVEDCVLLRVQRHDALCAVPGSTPCSISCADVWRAEGKPWADALHALETGSQEEGVSWVALEDVPQYFREGFCFYPTSDWLCEARVKAKFLNGVPHVSMKITVTQATRVIFMLSQPEHIPLDNNNNSNNNNNNNKNTGSEGSQSRRLTQNGCLLGIGLQVTARANSGDEEQVIVRSSTCSPDIFDATQTELHMEFQADVAIGMTLQPECSPYYVVPRVVGLPEKASRPYVLCAVSKDVPIGHEHPMKLSFVGVRPEAGIFTSGSDTHADSDALCGVALRQSTDVTSVVAPYQYRYIQGAGGVIVNQRSYVESI